ncbi:coxsackievirus and adenovirus receptor isoform X2 [Ambystoma mexicanum]|uniref:coxsackievirus and adenovirus receptor isoform X2 n=1 Tax=Ambystoma mexicanum TaxID=8296 RepID=UPI0037E9263F
MRIGAVPLPCTALLFLCVGLTRSLKIITPERDSFEKAQGEGIRLPCEFELISDDTGPLTIEWSLVPKDSLQSDQPIILYSGGAIYNKYPEMSNRVHFTSDDPRRGDASLNITGLKLADSGSYQCRVMKHPGTDNKKLLLTVSERPGKMKCYVDGTQEIGSDLKLKCEAKEGTPPLQYRWEKLTGTKKLPLTGKVIEPGVFFVKNASEEYSGTFKCTSDNRVGTDSCLLVLYVAHPTNVAGTIAGAVIGTLLGVVLLAVIVFCCCRKQKEKKYEKEVQHEIREDVAPPKSRTSTARSFIGSNHSSLGSLSPSNMDGYAKAQYSHIPSDEFERPPSNAPNYSTAKHNGLPANSSKNNGITVV